MLINPQTKKWVEAFIARPKAALLLDVTNDDLISCAEIISHIHEKLTGKSSTQLIKINRGENKFIGIEDIRILKKQLSLQANKESNDISRVISIEEADILTSESQNALLKIIEELPERTIICLTTTNKSALLPTITSRCFSISVLPIQKQQALNYSKQKNIDQDITDKAFLLSDGNASLFMSLVNGEETNFQSYVDDAKSFLSASVVERQKIIQSITKKDGAVKALLYGLKIVTKAAMRHSPHTKAKQRWSRNLALVIESEQMIKKNVSVKLVLLHLSVSL